ncbi:MAG: tetratricopeptide repeat protein [Candidatus Rokuibacteriota bacterium]|nr:MAG: tetratricopeptide repeat protein [Candidatus Rokubacteria bacterium]
MDVLGSVIMKRRLAMVATLAALLLLLPVVSPVSALDEPDRLFTVGERALADRFYPVARRTLERFVAQFPSDARQPRALLMLGKARLALNDPESALEALRRAQGDLTASGEVQDVKFWQAEALFRLKRFGEARDFYDEIVRTDAAGPLAPEALYGFGWSELELGQFETAGTAFRQFLATWAEHRLAADATVQLARALIEGRRFNEALPLLSGFVTKYPGSKRIPEAQYLLGWVKYNNGDPQGGISDLQAFLAANPSHEQAASARQLVAQGLRKYGNRAQLLQSYTMLMQQDPPTAEALSDAAGIANQLSRPKEFDAAWSKLKSDFPEHPLTRQLALDLAKQAFYKQKNWKEASALGQTAAQSNDNAVRAEAWLLVGESELRLERFPQAAKAFEAVGAVSNVDADTRFRALAGLGLARERQKEWKAALTAYQEVVQNTPDTTLRDWARERAAAVKSQIPKSNGAPKQSNGVPKRGEPGKKS